MKNLLIILTLSFLPIAANAQFPRYVNSNNGNDSLQLKRTQFSLETGTSFSTGTIKGNSYYVAPSVTYNISPKFRLNSTIYFINSNYSANETPYLTLGENQPRLFDRKANETVVFASGNYQVNNRLLITGNFVKNFNNSPNFGENSNTYQNNFQMMQLGMQYKLTPNVSLGADVRFIQSNNPLFPYYYGNNNTYMHPYGNYFPNF